MKKLKLIQLVILLSLFSLNVKAQDSTFNFSLEEARAYAVENGYQIQLAKLDVDKAERKVKETIAIGLPQVSGTGSYLNNLEIPATALPSEFFPGGTPGGLTVVEFGVEQTMTASVTANQLIFDGSYLVGLQATRVYLDLSKNELQKSENEIKDLVTQAYGNVLIAEENLNILKKNQGNLDQLAFETEETYKNGLAEEQDRDQLKLNLQTVTNQYENAGRQLEIAKNQLKYILGIPLESELSLKDDLVTVTNSAKGEDFANKAFSLDSHIDYKTILTQEKATELLWKQQKSTYLPKLSAFYTYQRNAFSTEFNFFSGGPSWNPGQFFGLNLQVPIFTSFANKNRVQQAKIDFQKVKVSKVQLEEGLKIQADNAKSAYVFALNQYKTNNENLALAERIYDKVKAKYDEGISSSLELTTANNQLLTAQQAYIQASYQLIDSKIKLDKALNNY